VNSKNENAVAGAFRKQMIYATMYLADGAAGSQLMFTVPQGQSMPAMFGPENTCKHCWTLADLLDGAVELPRIPVTRTDSFEGELALPSGAKLEMLPERVKGPLLVKIEFWADVAAASTESPRMSEKEAAFVASLPADLQAEYKETLAGFEAAQKRFEATKNRSER
jgi:hypothetical protein